MSGQWCGSMRVRAVLEEVTPVVNMRELLEPSHLTLLLLG